MSESSVSPREPEGRCRIAASSVLNVHRSHRGARAPCPGQGSPDQDWGPERVQTRSLADSLLTATQMQTIQVTCTVAPAVIVTGSQTVDAISVPRCLGTWRKLPGVPDGA